MKPYGFRCDKCKQVIASTRGTWATNATCLVYAKSMDDACDKMQDAIKEHDIEEHGTDTSFPKFTIFLYYPRRKPQRKKNTSG